MMNLMKNYRARTVAIAMAFLLVMVQFLVFSGKTITVSLEDLGSNGAEVTTETTGTRTKDTTLNLLERNNKKNYYMNYSFSVDTNVSKEEARKWKATDKNAGRIAKFLEDNVGEKKKIYDQNKTKVTMEQRKNVFAAGAAKEDDDVINDDNVTVPAMLLVPSATMNHQITMDGPLSCSTGANDTVIECCADWDTNVDNWWLHKPTWEVSTTTTTSNKQCFSPMMDPKKASFFQNIYDIQWKGNCSQVITSTQINSGYSADIYWLTYTFLNATLAQRPFQITRHDHAWLFGPQNKSHWAYCESEDITCLTLPISNCERDFVPQIKLRSHLQGRIWASEQSAKGPLDFQWLKEFMLRPTQVMRKKQFEMIWSMDLKTPCTTMHVRRGDTGLPMPPYRRYAAVQEYLDAAAIEEGDTILLLTDDQTTIDEINKYHKNYHWVYLNRTRHSGVDGGWESHVPSGDGPFEVLAIRTETYFAGICGKMVQGYSGFMKVIRGQMEAEGKTYKWHLVNTGVSKEDAQKWPKDGKERLDHFMKEMEEYRQKSNAMKKAAARNGTVDDEEATADTAGNQLEAKK